MNDGSGGTTFQILIVIGFDHEFMVANAIQIHGSFDHFDVLAEDIDHFLGESCFTMGESGESYSNRCDDQMIEDAFLRAGELTDAFD